MCAKSPRRCSWSRASSTDLFALPLAANLALFAAAAVAVGVAGWRIAALADRIADRTGLGEALTGAVFLGATTSLSGSVTSVTAALDGHADLAVGNALGGIAAQTAFLAVADISYRRANLEHAAASLANVMQAALLVVMLAIILATMAAPEVSLLGVHPASVLLVAAYLYGQRMVADAHRAPMWQPRRTAETREDVPRKQARAAPLAPMLARFALLAAVVAAAGWLIARAGIALSVQTGLSETAVGAVFTAVSTSLPELVTALSAVRQGAFTLAVGDIVGGNVFDTLFVAVSDFAYRGGSILHAVSAAQSLLIAVCMLQTGSLLMGFVRREKHGIANIGFESFLVLALYAGLVALLLLV